MDSTPWGISASSHKILTPSYISSGPAHERGREHSVWEFGQGISCTSSKLCSEGRVTQQSLFQQTQAHCQRQQILFTYGGGKNNLKEQMEILPEEHIKTRASQESQTQPFVLNLWRLTQLKGAESKNNLQVLSLWMPLQDPGAWPCFHRGIISLT